MIEVQGYAIVSRDDRIADAAGRMPAALRNEADWRYFQAGLDAADLVVLGRLGHEAHGNPKRRPRMVVSGSAAGLERRADGWWWNPARLPWDEAAAQALPRGGQVAVPGGRGVFDLFLRLGYDAFHLSRAEGVALPGGTPLFSGCVGETTAEALLRGAGLRPGSRAVLDAEGPVSLVVWRRGDAAAGGRAMRS